jgi:23S rRNA pseudouridine1911/1915/1917 synthase
MSKQFSLNWVIKDVNAGKLIKDFLKEAEVSGTALTDIKYKGGSILVNHVEVNVRYRLQADDQLTVIFPLECPSEGVKPEDIPLALIYEDQYLLVINKPAGMSTIPSREHPDGSLANALIGYYKRIGLEATSHIVTRLDRDTSGIVLIAKHRHIHHLFSKMQQNRGVKRTYEALADGCILEDSGTIEQPIARSEDSIIERVVHPRGQYSLTHFQVLERYREFTRIELQLGTGRTHQIRVHMAYIGHPLLGDDLYGGDTDLILRQALHCKRIQFIHPILGNELMFTAPLPEDMKKIMEAGR